MTSFAQQPDPGLTRDPAWRHILLTAKIQHAQQWDQSMPKHKGERYIKPIIPQLYPYSSLSPFAVMYARGHDNATEQLGYIVWFSQNEGVRFTVKATVFSIIIHYSSLLIILIVCVCTVWSFITVSFIIYTLKINLFFWGLCIDTNKKKTTNLFVEPLLTAEITAQHEMLRCLLTEVTLQTEQQQLYSETFSNSKLNNSEIRVWDKQGLTQNCSSPTYSVFLAFLIQNIIC